MFVCRRWHDIVLGEQQLWGFIKFLSSLPIFPAILTLKTVAVSRA
jgi:hypothetical protein